MNSKNKIWAIIPARSGSKGFKDKNIQSFFGKPLLAHSIDFAKKLNFIDEIFVSTDSNHYAKLAQKFGAKVPFLRSKDSSSDLAMEEDILEDIRIKCMKKNIELPQSVLWLRPTHPLRCIDSFNKAYKEFLNTKSSVYVATEADSRIFIEDKNKYEPVVKKFKAKSMVRRQDSPKAAKIFYGEFFNFPSFYNTKYMGDKYNFVLQSNLCSFDIDDGDDLMILEKIAKENFKKYGVFIH
tara:strand:- start:1684 stop:2397 length:714 start_codon:yes stop_codon:yes gene_type:complete